MTNRQGAPLPTRPRIGFNISRLHDDTIAVKHVKKLKLAAVELTLENGKCLKIYEIENIINFKQ